MSPTRPPALRLRSIAVIGIGLLTLTATAAASVKAEVEVLIASADLGAAEVSVSVVEAGPGTSVVEIASDQLMIPASNLKLFTSGAALHTLGPEFRFQTTLRRDGDRLIVVGSGDPGFGDPALLAMMRVTNAAGDTLPLDVDSFLELWVGAVVDAGMRNVSEIVVDDSVFDRDFIHPDWPRDQLNRRYCAEVAGLNFHLNRLHFFPEPRPGARPSLAKYTPHTRAVSIDDNQATSRVGAKDSNTAWIARKLETNRLTLYGNVKHAYRTPVAVTVHDMPTLFGRLLAERLAAAGVTVNATRLVGPGEQLGGDILGTLVYTPIATAVRRCNRDSQNLYAEALLKRMGGQMTKQPGSWLNGASIVRHVVHERLGSPALASRLKVVDGSGLSRNNRVAAVTVTAWLNSFHNDERLGGIFLDSLAVNGVSGTLKNRFRRVDLGDAMVQAKSGYINGVSCLSGYVTQGDGRRRCFSIMINDLRAPVPNAKRLQERIVAAIAADMAPQPVTLGSD
ncbi:MAG: D-alanyl-D-alanine carboxypeptidase/D-alanyl-D-alanine-endopeptidase [Phycisphaerales bacterium]|nr:D-alanyl-D-alanine carboxypeptidase/D-alanyl-D-alanine-endopeptidase [Phycisphaerales bacterium]